MAIQWFDTNKELCNCVADKTQHSTVMEATRGTVVSRDPWRVVWSSKRSRKIRHWRGSDEAHFWHWEDQKGKLY